MFCLSIIIIIQTKFLKELYFFLFLENSLLCCSFFLISHDVAQEIMQLNNKQNIRQECHACRSTPFLYQHKLQLRRTFFTFSANWHTISSASEWNAMVFATRKRISCITIVTLCNLLPQIFTFSFR